MWSIILAVAFLLFVAVVTWLSYSLGRTKTENPKAAGVVGFFLALIPPVGLIYLAILVLKEEVTTV